MINGIPAPLAKPTHTEPAIIPTQPPMKNSSRYPIRNSTGATNFDAMPQHFLMRTNAKPPKNAIRSIPAMMTAMQLVGTMPSFAVSMAKEEGYTKNVNISRNIAITKV